MIFKIRLVSNKLILKVSYRIKISLRVLLCGGNNNDDGGNVSNDDDRDISDDHNDNDRGDSGDIGGDAWKDGCMSKRRTVGPTS